MGRFSRAEPAEWSSVFMTKAEILNRLKSSNRLNRFDSEQAEWQDAFLLYNAVHGLTGKERLMMNCGKCFREVRDWLLK